MAAFTAFLVRKRLSLAGIASASLLALLASQETYKSDLSEAAGRFRAEAHLNSVVLQAKLERSFELIYQNLRTIARLPGVRDIAQPGTRDLAFHGGGAGFNRDTKLAVQEIYNNLATGIDLSEAYIVPLNLDPDEQHGGPKEPVVTFDQLIVGKHLEAGDTDTREDIPEIEIFEYRLMRKQLDFFKLTVPTEADINGLRYPAVSGPPVVTCDNRFYNPTQSDDSARTGMLYSVPFYDRYGHLAGCVSSVLLDHCVRKLLPATGYTMLNQNTVHFIRPASPADAKTPTRPSRIYAETLPLNFTDGAGPWTLECTKPDWLYWTMPDIHASRTNRLTRDLAIAITTLLIGIGLYQGDKARRGLVVRNDVLEALVKKRSEALLDATRRAGMAEVATGVLHNVGNVLTSVTTSASLLREQLKHSKVTSLGRTAAMLQDHKGDLSEFLTTHPKGKLLPDYIQSLAGILETERVGLGKEIGLMSQSIDHIKGILKAQQAVARIDAQQSDESISGLIDEAIRINRALLDAQHINVSCDHFADIPRVLIERHALLQILVNFIVNAARAIELHVASGASEVQRKIDIRTCLVGSQSQAERFSVSIQDRGVGIPPENMDRIFQHGFTTRTDGHGFGLHSAANAANRMGGRISVSSKGIGLGATFVLELPLHRVSSVAPATGELE